MDKIYGGGGGEEGLVRIKRLVSHHVTDFSTGKVYLGIKPLIDYL